MAGIIVKSVGSESVAPVGQGDRVVVPEFFDGEFVDKDLVNLQALYDGGEAGALYAPWVRSSLYEDSAGTTLASVDGPVGRMEDLSGNGNHATQSTADARPVLRYSGGLYYLEFDGVDDFLDSPLLTWSTDFFISCGMVIAGGERFAGPWRFLTSGGSPTATDQNKLEEYSESPFVRKTVYRRSPSALEFYEDEPVRPTAGSVHVSWNSNEDGVEGRTGVLYPGAGALADVSVGAKSLANGGDATLSLCRGYSGDFLGGREYGLVYLGRTPTDAEIDKANKAMMNRSGVSL